MEDAAWGLGVRQGGPHLYHLEDRLRSELQVHRRMDAPRVGNQDRGLIERWCAKGRPDVVGHAPWLDGQSDPAGVQRIILVLVEQGCHSIATWTEVGESADLATIMIRLGAGLLAGFPAGEALGAVKVEQPAADGAVPLSRAVYLDLQLTAETAV